MNLFGVGPTEIFVILIVILVLFGPDKLPEIAKKIGGASREIRDGLDSINDQMNTALEASMDLEKAQMIKPAESAAENSMITVEPLQDNAPLPLSPNQTQAEPPSPADPNAA